MLVVTSSCEFDTDPWLVSAPVVQHAPGNVGRRPAAREEGSFSYRNATIIEHDGQCAGCLIGYEIPDNPEPIPDDMLAIFVPLQELETSRRAPGT